MRTANTILTVIRERGRHGLPLERVYRLLFNRELYLRAYAKLAPHQGALTPGSTPETVDGMSLAKIDSIIELLRHERYRWKAVRRVHIPKSNGKMRPLGVPTWSDKLLQEVIRSILEAYYDPQFSRHSHGFRPNHGCHTALETIQQTWKGTKWFIEGDIQGCFDTIDHSVLLNILAENIHDGRFLELIRNLLNAGYMERWVYHRTLSGTPQGGGISPILANIYMDRFDHWVEQTLIPAHTRGTSRRRNPAYRRLQDMIGRQRKKGRHEMVKALVKARRQLPCMDPNDEGYRKLLYLRYADDFILGFAGPNSEAEAIKRSIRDWLSANLKLNLSEEKTLVTHAQTERARFLGYEVVTQHADDKLDIQGKRSTNGVVALRVPVKVIDRACQRYMRNGKPIHRAELTTASDYDIVITYQAEYRGLVQYYLLAHNVSWLNRLHFVMRTSLLKTLAHKHKTTVSAIARRYKSTVETPEGKTLTCLTVQVQREGKRPLIARFGGISLSRQTRVTLYDQRPQRHGEHQHTELLQRLLAERCEICGSTERIEVHHIRKLKDLDRPGRREKPLWVKLMAARQRKTLVVCRDCHEAIENGRPTKKQRDKAE